MDLALVYSQLIRVDGLDIWVGLSRMGCNRKAYAEALKTFCGDLEKKNAELPESLETENWKAYAAAVHAIKGGLEGIGALELARSVRELDGAVKKADYGFCKKNTNPFLEKVKTFIAQLRAGALFARETFPREPVSLEYMEETLGELCRLCASGSGADAENLAAELRTKTCNAETDALVETVCTYVENLDYHLVVRTLGGACPPHAARTRENAAQLPLNT